MKQLAVLLALCLSASPLLAQDNIHYQWMDDYARNSSLAGQMCLNPRRVNTPDIPGYHTYKADFHMHTIFSDASVSPTMRVIEAYMEGLDILAITDHHPTPRRGIDKGDLNAGFNEAAKAASNVDLKLIRGFEITGSEPVGHINILFAKDLNEYKMDYPVTPAGADKALATAVAEDAFRIANHPGWPDQNSTLSDYVAERMENGTLEAVEVFNHKEFYPLAIDHANRFGLAMVGATDSHWPTYYLYDQDKGHRDMTLVFAKDLSDDSLKEALRAGRTIAWANDILAGRPDLLRQFIHACIKVEFVKETAYSVHFRLFNDSAVPYVLEGDNPQDRLSLPAGGYAEAKRYKASLDKPMRVVNTYVSSTDHLKIPLSFLLQEDSDICMPMVDEDSIEFGEDGMSFRLTCDSGRTRYSLDGSEPAEDSPLYEGGVIHCSKPCTVAAVTCRDGQKSYLLQRQLNFSMAGKVKARKHGVSFKYYENDGITETAAVERIGVLKKSGVYARPAITDGEGKDHFGFIFTGVLEVPVTGLYQFTLMSNDGSDLFIGGVLACDNDQNEGYHAEHGSIFLQKGFHPFKIRYFEGYGGESFEIQWRLPGSNVATAIPDENFYLE